MRLGIIGGTFDPIHYGHLFVAEESRVRFRLDKVLFVPAGIPPHKKNEEITPPKHRYAMTVIGIHGNPAFECSSIEIDRGGVSYTIDTLISLREQYPQDEFFYITGIDAVCDLLTWHRHQDVMRMARFIAAARPGYSLNRLRDRLPLEYLENILLLGSTMLDISSTELRYRVRHNLPIRYLTPDGVVEYIRKHRLYR
ncbi:MAG TPA: nicotinate-nucleotide adenylyltransferase [Chthonomonas sp.]|jgi:nicotinate-nucleotide adenylyltransferase|uniref:nicotinate-nucleotide adenylyltransferase n=1 Tax=Chthonomonas sp. TaxID=2282153 RepID=UPI002B4B6662|nr:nicotinate-nucleotide adenylyltransferase [Chthonomonas sp.]HLH80885.1 nicotinate-nucleotide adenylyltransferase [Chthonomonas sp.]